MTDNVVWGTDFKAGLRVAYHDEITSAQVAAVDRMVAPEFASGGWIDTTPSDYVAPADDCA